MPLRVYCCASYLPHWQDERGNTIEWRREDWDTRAFIRAIKGDKFNGYAWLPVGGGRTEKCHANSRAAAFKCFGEWAAEGVTSPDEGPLFLVPLPSSKTVAPDDTDFPAYRLAVAAAAALERRAVWAEVLDVLRQVEPIPSAHKEGGPRDASPLYQNLRLLEEPVYGNVILIDDVLTSGAHLRAAEARLRDANVVFALCAVRSCNAQADDPWEQVEIEVMEFDPGEDDDDDGWRDDDDCPF